MPPRAPYPFSLRLCQWGAAAIWVVVTLETGYGEFGPLVMIGLLTALILGIWFLAVLDHDVRHFAILGVLLGVANW